jgi:hypothetical protein
MTLNFMIFNTGIRYKGALPDQFINRPIQTWGEFVLKRTNMVVTLKKTAMWVFSPNKSLS